MVRRITGRTLKQFVAEEIAGPLGADFQIGAAEADWGRVSDVVPPPPLPFDLAALDPDSPVVKTFTGPVADAAAANTPGWRRAEIGARQRPRQRPLGGPDAVRVARGGEVDGVRLLSPKTIDLIFDEQSNGVTWCSACRCASASATALPRRRRCPTSPTAGSASGAAGAAR